MALASAPTVLTNVQVTPGFLGSLRSASQVALMRRDLYRALAAETGGSLLPVLARDNLTSTFRRILDDFRSSYVLHFVPAGVTPGGVHTLDVQVNREGVDVRTRTEYEW